MSETLPNPPYKAPMIDQNGFITSPWIDFIRQIFKRTGGNIAPSNVELAGLSSTFNDQIAVLQTNITALQNQTVADIGEGTVL